MYKKMNLRLFEDGNAGGAGSAGQGDDAGNGDGGHTGNAGPRFAGTFHQNPRLFRARCAYTTDVLSVQSIAGETHCRHSFSCPRPLPTALPNRMRGNRHNGSRLSSSSVLLPESRCNNRCRRDGAMFGGGIDRKHRCRFRMYCYSNGECSVYAHRGTAPISISRLENTPF